MRNPIIIKVSSGLINILGCYIALLVVLYNQDGFGKGDSNSFFFWTIPLASGLSVSGNAILSFLKTRKAFIRIIFNLIVSGAISFGWVYTVFLFLGPWINTFSFPIIYLWWVGNCLQLVFLDRFLQRIEGKSKRFFGLILFPVTLLLALIVVYSSSLLISFLSRPPKETYLIPNTFEGRFRIIYGEKCGVIPKLENGRRVLEIPDNGLLIIQPNIEYGIIDHEYYLVNNFGDRVRMNMISDFEQRKQELPSILLGGTGAIGGPMTDGSQSTESPLAIHFSDFTVFNNDTTTLDQRTQFKLDQKFDSLTTVLVKQCRLKRSK